MVSILEVLNRWIIGIPILLSILFVGINLTIQSGFAQIRLLPAAMKQFITSFTNNKTDNHSGYKALCTALAATVGTGNIAGVAGAIAIGGPGAIFWIWVCAILGMSTKLAEVTLALHYRIQTVNQEYRGGPMYMIANGLPHKYSFLSNLYCIFGVIAAFGVGNATQVNAITDGIRDIASTFHHTIDEFDMLFVGMLIALLVWISIRSGAVSIGKWAEILVPFASVIYIILAFGVLIVRFHQIPQVISTIVLSAFCPKAFTGGIVGSIVMTIRTGVSRGIFTNEAGMGTAGIAHAAANVKHPVEQGLMGIIEVFLDTVVICTLTAFVILCSSTTISYGSDPGIALTLDAFSAIYGDGVKIVITCLVCILAFATILGWGLYGARCLQYLFGEKGWDCFFIAQLLCIVVSVMLKTSVIWSMAEIINGLMAIPNLIALILLMPNYLSILHSFQKKQEAYRCK